MRFGSSTVFRCLACVALSGAAVPLFPRDFSAQAVFAQTVFAQAPASSPGEAVRKGAGAPVATTGQGTSGASPEKPAEAPAVPAAPAGPLSEAEQIARLRRSIDEDSERLKGLKFDLQSPAGEYAKAQQDFQEIDGQVVEGAREQEKLKNAGKDAEAVRQAEDLKPLQKRWQLAKERFQLAIEERKGLQAKIVALDEKILHDKLALARLTGEAAPAKPAENGTAAPGPVAPAVPPTGPAPAAVPQADATGLPTAAGNGSSNGDVPKAPGTLFVPAPDSKELVSARQKAQQTSAAVAAAMAEVETAEARVAAIKKSITLDQDLRSTARKKADNASDTERELASQVQRRMVEGAAQQELNDIWRQIAETKTRHRDALREAQQRTDTIEEKRNELEIAQAEHRHKAEFLERLQSEESAARQQVAYYENPFNLHNVLQWIIDHGPKLVLILLVMYVLTWFARRFGRQIFNLILGGRQHGTHMQRENRANTLAGVAQNAASIAITTGGALMIFEEIGIDVTVLMGGVAVLGLAIAFGAQNLIKDYFTGFMILFENQYALNDVVKIGGISGQVEQITLRLTVLRDIEGSVHFVPNGTISTVTNLTHGWSRAVFDIGVAFKERVDDVMNVLLEIARDLRKDSFYGPMILEEPTMLGVDQIGDSAVIIKFYIKTRPLKQWDVKRETLRRIKNRFDELGIEIPYPHQTVYYHCEPDGTPLPDQQTLP